MAGLVAAERGTVEPLVHAPTASRPRSYAGTVTRDAFLQRDTLSQSLRAGSSPSPCDDRLGPAFRTLLAADGSGPSCEVLLDDPASHASLVCPTSKSSFQSLRRTTQGELQPFRRFYASIFASGPHTSGQHDVVVGEVDDRAAEPVGDRRTGRASGGVVGPEHEVVDEKLRAPLEQVSEKRRPCRCRTGTACRC